jgi:hypothetical protein
MTSTHLRGEAISIGSDRSIDLAIRKGVRHGSFKGRDAVSVGQWLSGAIVACLFACVPQVSAQTSSATSRGQVTREAGPAANARVTATNIETGFARTIRGVALPTRPIPLWAARMRTINRRARLNCR